MTEKTSAASPPVAEKRPFSFSHHGITVEDPYHWLKDQSYPVVDDPDVLDYLKAENAYFEANMAAQKPLVDSLFEEMKARIKEDDSSVPQKDGDWIYWSKFDEGAQYRKHYRKAADGSGTEQLILDENALAEGKDYFRLGAVALSRDAKIIAYSVDDNGSERYQVRFRCLDQGKDMEDNLCGVRAPWGDDAIEGSLGNIVFTSDGTRLLYGLVNDNWRVDKIMMHKLGTPQSEDQLIYEESDEGFAAGVALSAQEDWLIINTGDNETSEIRLIPANNPSAEPVLIKPRKKGLQYSVDIRDGQLFILTNDDHINFRLASAPLTQPSDWKTLVAGSDEVYLTDFSLFKNFFVTESRIAGLDQVEIRDYASAVVTDRIKFPEASYDAGLSDNPEYDVTKLRLAYESMVTPDTVYDYHIADKRLETLKVQEIPSGFDPASYETERLMITARDGVQVPVSVLYKKGFKKDGSQPLHLYAYGAYGYAVPPGFSTTRFSLVNRGFAYAIAHIRGGDDLGYGWYLDGKLKKRTNTFNDFVDVGKGLIERGYTSAGKLTASGGSAGGELMGAVTNQAPEIFGAVVAHVPFVDVLNTMLDESLPLTPGEWPEWGNPITSKEDFELIRSYSPYDQVEAKAYPPMLYTGGLNDPRVTYWEPAKMVAKLRSMKTDDNLLLLKINMGAGHGGKSGRWNSLYETAEEQAFILWQLGMGE
ncbi:S9 family peptidase [Sphingorhabdus arenilitoris]|uniref:S9 family peptidase n=1 Tax=Sphingorhabdus arenilitoris TaxID=1490041 RepID=A0ABV8RHZ2_9SPHN